MTKLQNSPVLKGNQILWSPQICSSVVSVWFSSHKHQLTELTILGVFDVKKSTLSAGRGKGGTSVRFVPY